MNDDEWERQLEELFSDAAPEPDPDHATPSAEQHVEGGTAPSGAPNGAPIGVPTPLGPVLPPDREVKRLGLLDVLLPVSVIGEAAAAVALIAALYWYSPLPLRSSHFLYVGAVFACMTLVLLFVQWLLARRLARAENLVQKRSRQLGQAFTVIRRYHQQLERSREAADGREMT